MKKFVSVIVFVLMCFCLVACGNNEKYAIDNYSWVMYSIQSIEQNGDFIAYAPSNNIFDKDSYPNAVSIDMTCNAKNGSFSIFDKTNNKTYNGTYEVTNDSSQTAIYKIVIEEKSGTAVVSITKHQNETVIPTMILSIDDFVLNFQSI